MNPTYEIIATGHNIPTLRKTATTYERAEALFWAMEGTLRAQGDTRDIRWMAYRDGQEEVVYDSIGN